MVGCVDGRWKAVRQTSSALTQPFEYALAGRARWRRASWRRRWTLEHAGHGSGNLQCRSRPPPKHTSAPCAAHLAPAAPVLCNSAPSAGCCLSARFHRCPAPSLAEVLAAPPVICLPACPSFPLLLSCCPARCSWLHLLNRLSPPLALFQVLLRPWLCLPNSSAVGDALLVLLHSVSSFLAT